MSKINSPHINDALLLKQVQQGNKEAFNCLYEKYRAQAYSNAFRRLLDADHAKDIVQDIFVNIWIKKETVIDNFPAYLNVAVRNRVFKVVKKQKMTSAFLDMVQDIPDLYQGEADSNIQYQEFQKAYEALLLTLPPKRQLIFRLRFHNDFTTKAIAFQMGITRKTVQNQLARAIEQLRIVLLPCFILMLIGWF